MSDPSATKRLLILTGDHSADNHAASAVRALRQIDPAWQVSGVGGSAMASAGVELIEDHAKMNVIGPLGALAAIPSHRALARKILDWVDRHKPQVAMLIDYGVFHLHLGPKLRQRGVRVIYFIPPQIWASRPWRIRKLRRAADQVLCILPFEQQYYSSRGVPATFVGNPLVNQLPPPVPRDEFAKRHGLDPAKTWIGIFPGSRRMEISYLLKRQLDAAKILNQRFPNRFEFALAQAANLKPDYFANVLREAGADSLPGLKVLQNQNHALLSAADFLILTSGTVTLEAALYETPLLLMYRGNPLVYYLARLMITVDHIGLPNVLSNERIVPELWQWDVTPERIAETTLQILEPSTYAETKQKLANVAAMFANHDTPRKVAEAIVANKMNAKTPSPPS